MIARLENLSRTAELLPNSAEVPLTAAFIYKRQNRYRDRFAALHRAEALDPRNRRVVGYLSNTFRWVRNWPEALQASDRYAALAGDETNRWRWWRANDEFRLTGDIRALKKALAEEANAGPSVDCNWLDLARYETAMLERDYAGAARFSCGGSTGNISRTSVTDGGTFESLSRSAPGRRRQHGLEGTGAGRCAKRNRGPAVLDDL